MSFTLKVDPVKVDRDYKTLEHSRTRLLSHNPMATKLEDLGFTEIQHHTQQPLFELKETNSIVFGHLKDYVAKKSLPHKTDICCMYCTESFSTPPLGIPINFFPSYSESTYRQESDEHSVTLRQDIFSKKEEDRLREKGVTIVARNYFETDGNFCSFPCMIAYYKLHQQELKYKDSQGLIRRLHQKLYDKPLVWRCAPDIRLLNKFGGHMTVEEFRSTEASNYSESVSLQHVTFKDNEIPSLMVPVSGLFTYLKS